MHAIKTQDNILFAFSVEIFDKFSREQLYLYPALRDVTKYSTEGEFLMNIFRLTRRPQLVLFYWYKFILAQQIFNA